MNQEEIIKQFEVWADENQYALDRSDINKEIYRNSLTRNAWIGYQAALASKQVNVWEQVIDDALITSHLGVADCNATYENAKAKLNELIDWHINIDKFFKQEHIESNKIKTYCLGYTHEKCDKCNHSKNWGLLNDLNDTVRLPIQQMATRIDSDKCRMTNMGEFEHLSQPKAIEPAQDNEEK